MLHNLVYLLDFPLQPPLGVKFSGLKRACFVGVILWSVLSEAILKSFLSNCYWLELFLMWWMLFLGVISNTKEVSFKF